MKPLVALLLAALGPAAVLGLAAGTLVGWHYSAAGFPLLLLEAMRRTLLMTVLGTAAFVVLFELGRRLAARRLAARLVTPLAAALAAAPFVALAGYRLNRARAVRPSDILEPWALVPNLKLLAGCFVAYLLIVFALHHFTQRPPRPRSWPAASAVALLVVLHAGLFVAFRSAAKDRPDVLLLVVDALRADHLGCYGYGRDTTPAIDALARDGVVFRQAISSSSFTKTSVASLMTGRHPYQHGVYWGSRQLTADALSADLLPETETTLAEVMHEHGYLTAAWVQNSQLRRVMGFAQGFVAYHDQQGSIDRIHRRFRRWLDRPGRRYGYFSYLHYIDLHDPYRPEPPYDTLFGPPGDVYAGVDFSRWGEYLQAVREGRRTLSDDDVAQLVALYDGQLRAIDDEIGRLLAELKERRLYANSLIVLTADHGDGFMEHGFISHSLTPYDELVRVPLIVKFPQGRFAGEVVASQVRLVDLMPTVLAAVDLRPRLAVDGCNLLPWLGSGTPPRDADPLCRRAVIEVAEDDGYPTLAIRTERFKYIHRESGEDELYDLRTDPGERHNRIAALAVEAAPLRQLALELVARRPEIEALELDEELVRELKALGYVADGW